MLGLWVLISGHRIEKSAFSYFGHRDSFLGPSITAADINLFLFFSDLL